MGDVRCAGAPRPVDAATKGGGATQTEAEAEDETGRRVDGRAPCTLRTETGARSQLRLLTTTERPRSRRWEEGGAAVVQ